MSLLRDLRRFLREGRRAARALRQWLRAQRQHKATSPTVADDKGFKTAEQALCEFMEDPIMGAAHFPPPPSYADLKPQTPHRIRVLEFGTDRAAIDEICSGLDWESNDVLLVPAARALSTMDRLRAVGTQTVDLGLKST